ncbi:endonuclease/exonuclease/phosphatase family protein [Candidatus Halobonum tyrrellensis]|uniref:Endonuclease/exonuclease/phosphatase domain-containing protein n=1 Tax=Candidatus Halobonum tyrrellensis G22 TaxID=1324957 RepID=V4GNC7_9EURY|nr:endonuclease/exonuclease/phosphatase family protein [Candidatus Halobonum tyrrellensis]ESP86886.1 hypothetical protein K933_16532 [Candidatus Halobonum tyrrellensis G22]
MPVEVTRRAALLSLASGVVVGRTSATGPNRSADPVRTPEPTRTTRGVDATDDPAVTLATRNLYLGADLFRLFAEREGSPAAVIGSLLRQVDASAVERRMDAIAGTLASTRPDVVGVQEAALIRTDESSDGRDVDDPDATTVRYDFLELLREGLSARGAAYDVAVVSETTDAEFPALVDDERVDVRLTDRDAVLVRRGVTEVTDTRTATFDTALTVPVGDGFTLTRGYAAVDLRVRGRDLTAASTHLEPADPAVRTAQARQLRSAVSSSPAAVLGDLNDGPADPTQGTDPGAYEVLAEAFDDAHAASRPDGAVEPTCCFPPSLRDGDPETALTGRYDVVLSRGLRPTAARRVGVDPDARVDADGDLLWPSDHAGVVASFDPAGTGGSTAAPGPTATTGTTATNGTTTSAAPTAATPPADTASPAATAAPSTRGTTDAEPSTGTASTGTASTGTAAPGFGALAAVAGALAAGAGLAWRSNDPE